MSTIRGIQPLAWGTVVTTGYVTETTTESTKTDEAKIEDEQGDVVTSITNFGVMTDVTLEVIPKSGVTSPEVGDVFSYGPSGSAKDIQIISIDKKRTNKDAEKWSIKGNSYPNVDLTP